MTAENDFLPFATGSSANVLSQSDYAALDAVTNGFKAGVAPSNALNKTWRQSSIMAAVMAQFIVAETGQAAIDDGTTATLLTNFTKAVVAASKQRVVLTDTGAANAYAAANAVPMTALPTASGTVQTVQIAHTNTGSSTYAPDGLAAKPIYGLGGVALQGNELPVNGIATLVSYVGPLLNGGALCWVLYECIGGAQQVGTATASQHALQMGSANGRLLGTPQVFTASGTYTPTPGTTKIIVEILGAGGAGGGANSSQASIGGGGGGGAFQRFMLTTVPASVAVTVGAGGTGASAGTGGNGGSSSFGTYGTCSGGSGAGAAGSSSPPVISVGGPGGTTITNSGVTSLVVGNGAQGTYGMVWSAGGAALSGGGGGSGMGAAGSQAVGSGAAAIAARANSGAGGSGACNNNSGGSNLAGGAGGSGLVVVYEYGTASTVA